MSWLYGGLALLVLIVVVVQVNRLRFERRLAGEWRALVAAHPTIEPRREVVLPALVARYRELAVGDHAPFRTLRIVHGGTFCTSATAKPAPIRGRQLFTADPPGFVWAGRIRMAPGVWVDARDLAVAGTGSMRVLIDDTIVVADAHGAAIDQGAALRLLAELVWLPTALFDARYVAWTPIDADRARATLGKVSGIFTFGADGLPTAFSAERAMDHRGMQPWGGTYRDWREASGLRVPFEASVTWHLPEGPFTYAHWFVESMVYE